MDELSKLFAAYREAVPDPEASAGFMPGLWRKIESRQSPVLVFRRLVQIFVTAAVCILLIGSVVLPRLQKAPIYTATYVDVLADEHTSAEMAYADAARSVPGSPDDGTEAPPIQ